MNYHLKKEDSLWVHIETRVDFHLQFDKIEKQMNRQMVNHVQQRMCQELIYRLDDMVYRRFGMVVTGNLYKKYIG